MQVHLIAVWVVLIGNVHSFVKAPPVFVDKGDPYNDGPLKVGAITISKTADGSPKHGKVYFPLEDGQYSVIFFVGGFKTLILAEFYETFLKKVAAHGFFVFGVDYDFPLDENKSHDLGQDVDIYFQQLNFYIQFMVNRTVAVPRWDKTGLLCHSVGCDITLKMGMRTTFPFNSTVFLDPHSQVVHSGTPIPHPIPGLMYGSELSEEGPTHCNLKGYDYIQFYNVWACPRIAIDVKAFGHCDLLDPVPWEACHVSHFCTTPKDSSQLNKYKQFAQGVVSSFFITMLQGRRDALSYVTDQTRLTLPVLVHLTDVNC